MTIKLEPQCHKESDCILEVTTDAPRQKLTLYHIYNLRISPEDGSSKLESGSF